MKIIVNPHKCVIDKTPVNEQEINITKCEFEFADEITDDFVKEAYFTLNGATYKQIIVDNECDIPSEVLEKKGDVEIGVVAFLAENDETFKRYNPSPAYFPTWQGSLKDAENSEPITPTDKEQIEQILNDVVAQVDNLDVDAEKEEHVTTITITKKDGTQKNVQVLDGEKGDKGDKGDAGSIKFIIVQVLPTENIEEDAMYLVPLADPESQENRFAEYIYVNGTWELLGKIGIQIDLSDYYTKQETNTLLDGKADVEDIPDLTDYVKDTDYATSSKAGVIKIAPANYGCNITGDGYLLGYVRTYQEYLSNVGQFMISKGTLENVITGKGLVSNTDYPTSQKGGVVINNSTYGASINSSGIIYALSRTNEQYANAPINYVISKGTLDNVLNAKIGDINSVLDAINGEIL